MENLKLIISGALDQQINERQANNSFRLGKTVQRYEEEHSFNPINFDPFYKRERDVFKSKSISRLLNLEPKENDTFLETF